MKLDNNQKMAVEHLDGAGIIIAAPGSGKTRVVTERVKQLLKVTNKHQILALTFTNKAVKEMKDRLDDNDIHVSTFHSFYLFLLRNYLKFKNAICNDSHSTRIMRKILKEKVEKDKENGVNWSKYPFDIDPGDLLSFYSYANNNMIFPTDPSIMGEAKKFFNSESTVMAGYCRDMLIKFTDKVSSMDLVDFENILTLIYNAASTNLHFAEKIQQKYKHIIVDEFHDTSILQYRIMRSLFPPSLFSSENRSIITCADPDQCIYGWRGANYDNVKLYMVDYNPTVYTLPTNYRSGDFIIEGSNQILSCMSNRHLDYSIKGTGKSSLIKCYSPENSFSESMLIAQILLSLPKEETVGILLRTKNYRILIETALRKMGIVYSVFGLPDIFDSELFDVFLCYLRWIVNPNDLESLIVISGTPSIGIGPKTITKLITKYMKAETSEDFATWYCALSNLKKSELELQKKLRLLKFDLLPRTDLGTYIMEITGLKEFAETKEKWIEIRPAIESIFNEIALLPQSTSNYIDFIRSVLDLITLMTSDKSKESNISLLTIYLAKGLEFDNVIIPGVYEGNLPHRRKFSEDEEDRVFYVGMTRAKKRLILTCPRSNGYGNQLSRSISSKYYDTIEDVVDKYKKKEIL